MTAKFTNMPELQAAISVWLMLTVSVIAGEPFRQIKETEIARRF